MIISYVDTVYCFSYLECLAKLVAHDVVQQRIDARRHEIQDARHVSNVLEDGTVDGVLVLVAGIHGEQTLRMERRPTDEERHDDRN